MKGEAMPYKLRESGQNWEIVNTETDEVVATHEPPNAKEDAERQLDILHHIEKDERWDKED